MIWDSRPWKVGLLKDAELIERWALKVNCTARRGVIFERKIFGTAYAIRKLFEADKVCTSLQDKTVTCHAYARTSPTMAPWNSHRLDEHFDLGAALPDRLTAVALVNQIIHSHIFFLQENDESHIDGFVVASRQGKTPRLFSVSLVNFCALMREIGRDHPTESHVVWDDHVNGYRTLHACADHPLDHRATRAG